jgi:hypothetical protein
MYDSFKPAVASQAAAMYDSFKPAGSEGPSGMDVQDAQAAAHGSRVPVLPQLQAFAVPLSPMPGNNNLMSKYKQIYGGGGGYGTNL